MIENDQFCVWFENAANEQHLHLNFTIFLIWIHIPYIYNVNRIMILTIKYCYSTVGSGVDYRTWQAVSISVNFIAIFPLHYTPKHLSMAQCHIYTVRNGRTVESPFRNSMKFIVETFDTKIS